MAAVAERIRRYLEVVIGFPLARQLTASDSWKQTAFSKDIASSFCLSFDGIGARHHVGAPARRGVPGWVPRPPSSSPPKCFTHDTFMGRIESL